MASFASGLRTATATTACVYMWMFLTSAVALNALAPSSGSATNGTCVANAPLPNASAPLAIEVTDEYGPYRGDHVVMVSDISGLPLVTLACSGPHDAVVLSPGSYRVMAFVYDVRSQEVTVNVPPAGTSVALKLEPAPGAPPRGADTLF